MTAVAKYPLDVARDEIRRDRRDAVRSRRIAKTLQHRLTHSIMKSGVSYSWIKAQDMAKRIIAEGLLT